MILIRDTVQSYSTPIITWLVIVIITFVFWYAVRFSANGLMKFIIKFCLIYEAIAAVLGVYILFLPTARVVTIIPILIIPWFVQIPALVYIGLWFFIQVGSGLVSRASPKRFSRGGMARWANRRFFSGDMDCNFNSFFNQKKTTNFERSIMNHSSY